MTILWCAFLLVGLRDGDPPTAAVKGVEDKIRPMIEKEFAGRIPETLAAAYAGKLAGPIARSATPEWKAKLLEELPQALQFHRFLLEVGDLPPVPGLPPFVLPPDEVLAGIVIELDYLVERTRRAASLKVTPELRKAVDAQIDRLMAEGAALTGDQKEFATLASVWKGTLDTPYHACLDRPLAEKDLEEVLTGMRKTAEKAKGEDPKLFVREVREAVYQGVGRCFSEFDAHQKKSDAWRERKLKKLDEWLRARGVEVK